MALVNGDFYANLMSGGSSDDDMYGFQGNDNMDGGVGNDFLNGGMGVDTADYSDSTGGIHVDLAAQVAYDDCLGGVDQLHGFETLTAAIKTIPLRVTSTITHY